MRRSLDHITVTVRCIAQKSISLLGFPATTFPFRSPSGITTAGNVEKKKNRTRTHNMQSITKVEFCRRINSKTTFIQRSFRGILSSATYVFPNFFFFFWAVFLDWRFRSWRISSPFLRRLHRVRLPLMCFLFPQCLIFILFVGSGTTEEWMAPSSPGHTAYRRDGRDWLPG